MLACLSSLRRRVPCINGLMVAVMARGWGMPATPLAGGLGGEPVQFRMGPDYIIVLSPSGQHGPCLHQGGE